MSKELGKSLLKIIGFGIVSSPLALIGHMYYSSTQVDKQKYITNLCFLNENELGLNGDLKLNSSSDLNASSKLEMNKVIGNYRPQ